MLQERCDDCCLSITVVLIKWKESYVDEKKVTGIIACACGRWNTEVANSNKACRHANFVIGTSIWLPRLSTVHETPSSFVPFTIFGEHTLSYITS